MSRNTKWKLEKAKVKVVFRLQFHATHIPQSGWNNLFISFIPLDSGKATAKTNKANVRNGTCKWADPIYESTRLLQDSRSKQYEEKIYKLVVAMGTSRSSLLGEASINLSEYVDALKPIVVALPLHGSDSGAILHVTVQLLTSKTGFREFEQQREVSDRGVNSNSDHDGGRFIAPGETVVSRGDKVNSRIRFRPEQKEHPSLDEESGFSEEYADSAAGFDVTSNTSGSLYAEKPDNSSIREIDSIKSTFPGEFGGASATQSPTMEKGQSDHHVLVHGTSDWFNQWGGGNSVHREMAIAYEENSRLRGALEAADLSIHELRQEIMSLQNFADGVGFEAHKLTEQVAIEISSEQKLAKEVSMLKLECSRFRHELDLLRSLKMNPSIPGRKTLSADQANPLLIPNLQWLKGLENMEKQLCQLQTKVHLESNCKDLTFLSSDLEALCYILLDLKQGTERSVYELGEIPAVEAKLGIGKTGSAKIEHVMSDTGLGVELCHPEGVLLPGLLESGTGSGDATMQGEIFKMLRELDESKAERENLVRKMDQMECYYEALIQELEENQKQIHGELQNLRHEHSSCIYTFTSTKAQMEAMHQQMNNELLQLTEERDNLDVINKELERRTAASEAALRRARMNYSIAVNKLQKDLEVLSLQVFSMYETNENLIRNALSQASEPLVQSCKDAEMSLLTPEDSNTNESPGRNVSVKSHQGDDKLFKDLKCSLTLQEELYKKIQDELWEMHLGNMHLDVFSLTLHQALVEAASNGILKKEEELEYLKQLELSTRTSESLKLKLQNITDEICTLKEERAICVSRCNDLALENQALKENLRGVADEKLIFSEKIEGLETLVTDYSNYKCKYEDLCIEKEKLAFQLEQAAADNQHLSSKVSLLQEEVMMMKMKVGENESLQKIVNYLRERLEDVLATSDKHAIGLLPPIKTEHSSLAFKEFVSLSTSLEEYMRSCHDKILWLMEENKDLLNERDVTSVSLASAEAELKCMKQKVQLDVPDMLNKLNVSSTLVDKLQNDFETAIKRIQVSLEAEEKYAKMTQDLLSDFTKMEAAVQELTLKSEAIADEIMALKSVVTELEEDLSFSDKVKQENLSLTVSLQSQVNETDMLTKELADLSGAMGSLQDELSLLRGIKLQLEADILGLNCQLKEKDDMLLHLNQRESELNHLKQQILHVETEKLDLHHQVSHLKLELDKGLEERPGANSELQLLEMHGLAIAADVDHTVIVKQYKLHVEELFSQLEQFDQYLQESAKKNLDLTSRLNNCLADKETYTSERTKLLSDLEALRSEFESSVALNRAIELSNSAMATELKECKKKCELSEASYASATTQSKFETDELKSLLSSCQNEMDNLLSSKEELEIWLLILETTVYEMSLQIHSHGDCIEAQSILQKQCGDLTRKLSEQMLKTEEFKNLSIHLKELKDKADAEHMQVREKREAERTSGSSQDSLRIAFIKEQYETKLLDLRHQLSISKKHGEEMLWKLQDALDELENRKKCEASQVKRNEELVLKITELEAELQSVLSDNREKFMACEQLKAELDCSVMSLDCCKEEKNQLSASLQVCSDEKCRMADEVELLKEQFENLKIFMRRAKTDGDINNLHCSINRSSEIGNLVENSLLSTSTCTREAVEEGGLSRFADYQSSHLAHSMIVKLETEDEGEISPQEGQDALTNTEEKLSALRTGHINSVLGAEHENLLENQQKAQLLLSSIDRLQMELERLRSENTHFRDEENLDELHGEGLQREQVHLEKVTEELGNLSSLYNDSARSGNSVERVLALELELAEALQGKKKSSIQFQSSFLKLHSDEAAVFQSFKDINELIKDMLEMKERYSGMEAELKEMHGRYSQLSLDFAEVEGERQKLTMMLKNVRSPKRLLSRSLTSSHEELSS